MILVAYHQNKSEVKIRRGSGVLLFKLSLQVYENLCASKCTKRETDLFFVSIMMNLIFISDVYSFFILFVEIILRLITPR